LLDEPLERGEHGGLVVTRNPSEPAEVNQPVGGPGSSTPEPMTRARFFMTRARFLERRSKLILPEITDRDARVY
jgi:hypothetical protein